MAYNAEYMRKWRAANRERRNAADRARYAATPEKSKTVQRVKQRRRRGRDGAGLSFAQRRVSRWKKRSFVELMSEYTFQQGRFDYEAWCDRVEAELDRELEGKACAELSRSYATARDSSRWAFERWVNQQGNPVWSCRRPLAKPST